MAKNVNEVAQELVKQGLKKEVVTIKDVLYVGEKMITIVIDKEVNTAKKTEQGAIEIVKSDTINVAIWQLRLAMLEHRRLNVCTSVFGISFRDAKQLLKGMKIAMIDEEVKQGDEYSNPFHKEQQKITLQNDVVLHHVVEFLEVADEGKQIVMEQTMKAKLGQDGFLKWMEQRVMDTCNDW